MKILFLCVLLTNCLAAFNNGFLGLLLLQQRRHRNMRCGRRCRLGLGMLTLPIPMTGSTPVVDDGDGDGDGGGCFPDDATFERQTKSGGFETIFVKSLVLGDMVRCYRAPLGPATESPQVGVCRYMGKNHDEDVDGKFEQIYCQEDGVEKMLALTDDHIMWSANGSALQGPVKQLDISDMMFVPARSVKQGDTIAVLNKDNRLTYCTVSAHRQQKMHGLHNPAFSDGGIPFVNGVLATTSANTRLGGHWPHYFSRIWKDDAKFVDIEKVRSEYHQHEWTSGMDNKTLVLDSECFLKGVISDLKNGVDAARFDSFPPFAQAYLLPCTSARRAM